MMIHSLTYVPRTPAALCHGPYHLLETTVQNGERDGPYRRFEFSDVYGNNYKRRLEILVLFDVYCSS